MKALKCYQGLSSTILEIRESKENIKLQQSDDKHKYNKKYDSHSKLNVQENERRGKNCF